MPAWFAAAAPAIGQAVGAIGGTALGAASTGNLNRKNRFYDTQSDLQDKYFSRIMMQKQHDMNIEDWDRQNKYNRYLQEDQRRYEQDMWRMQNEYDSPQAQMERFRKAGLNPNLIYGQMGSGQSMNISPAVRSNLAPSSPGHSTSKPSNFRVPNFDLTQGIMSIWDAKQKAAQTDNIKAATDVAKQQAALLNVQGIKTLADTDLSKIDYKLKNEILKYNVDAARLNTQKIQNDMDIANAHNLREQEKQPLNLDQLRQTIKESKNRQELQQVELDLRKLHINPGDPGYWRIMMYMLNAVDNYRGNPMKVDLTDNTK